MVRIDRIYTRGGDRGQTSLGDGSRVSKLHPRLMACGLVDEVNCALGTAAAINVEHELTVTITRLQQFLFDLGADLCVPQPTDNEGKDTCSRVTERDVERLEALIDRFSERLQPLNSFVLPGGCPLAAALHLTRAVCRRAELDMLQLNMCEPLNPQMLIAMNRLSDLLFVMARIANHDGRQDVLWQPGSALTDGI
jgi:cob(I)alamin adenosyltransferase